tara:strand:+ start:4031 stop:5278 length:1248 start_codon:yes stop_codon:yes gene_type:complete
MVAPLLLPLAGLLGGLFMQNREARANQARLLATRNADMQRMQNIRGIQNIMGIRPQPSDPNVSTRAMVGGQPGVLENIPSVLTAQRRDPVESGLLRTRMLGQDAARERGETVEPDMTPGPGLLAKELRATEASMPFRATDADKRTMIAQQLLGMSDPNIRENAATRLVDDLLPEPEQVTKPTPYTDIAKLNEDFDNGLISQQQYTSELQKNESDAVLSIADQFKKLTGATIPSNFQAVLDKDGKVTKAVEPIPGSKIDMQTQAIIRKKEVNLRNLEKQIDNYQSLVNEYGFELLDSPERNALATAYTSLLMNMKEYLNLGVLNGPDLEIMERMIKDPTSWMTAGSSFLAGAIRFFDGDTRNQQQLQKEFFGNQLDQLRKTIQQSRETMLDVYKDTGIIPGVNVPSYDASQIEGAG